jgi:hypothetical protein
LFSGIGGFMIRTEEVRPRKHPAFFGRG